MKARVILFLCWLFLLPMAALPCTCIFEQLDSLNDLEDYKFIALVKITSLETIRFKNKTDQFVHQANFSILELLRGNSISNIEVDGGNAELDIGWTSCDMGMNTGEEWLVFAYETDEGSLKTGYCSYSRKYRNTKGERDRHYQITAKRLEKTRKILSLSAPGPPQKDGVYLAHYPDGRLELEAHYQDGALHGKRTTFFRNGQIQSLDYFDQGVQSGKSLWYYRNGILKRDYSYKDDHFVDSTWLYHENGQLLRKSFFDTDGVLLSNVSYSYGGELKSHVVFDKKTGLETRSEYRLSGKLHYTTVADRSNYGFKITKQYYPNGQLEGIWDDRPDGGFLKQVKRWNKKGELISHKKWRSKDRNDFIEIVEANKDKNVP